MLVYTNRSATPYEIITTVDGLDVLSGKPGSRSHNGYMLQAGAVLRIEGFRKSAEEVAASVSPVRTGRMPPIAWRAICAILV